MNNCCREVCRSDSASNPNRTLKVLLLCCAMMLGACGNKGDLYIPQEPTEESAAVDQSKPTESTNTGHGFE